jgi:hypothetical protein
MPAYEKLQMDKLTDLVTEQSEEAFENKDLKRLYMFFCLLPVFGILPAAWTLYNRKSDRQHRAVSRLSITLMLSWLLGYVALNSGAVMTGETSGLSVGMVLLLLNGVLTSGYFVTSFWLMWRLHKNQSLQLPGLSQIAKHLP